MKKYLLLPLLAAGIWQAARLFRRWNERQYARAIADSQLIETKLGRVEYHLIGQGPVILHFHGGVVAHNGWYMIEFLIEAGFTVLTPSRPGYLRTPLDGRTSAEQQADLAAALLEALDMEAMAVVGVSAGGPPALQFALRHAAQTQALVLLSALTQQTSLTEDQQNSLLGRLVMSPAGQNITYFLIYQVMTRVPGWVMGDFVRTETTYTPDIGREISQRILADPQQRAELARIAQAMVPAKPRFPGMMNDLDMQQTLPRLPLERIDRPALIVHSRFDGDIPYENATFAAGTIPDAELVTLDQFGHFIWLGDPEVTASWRERVSAFLRHHISNKGPD
ncbi:MAG: alpha/beta hydrolase [Ardenticatenaceae bacterium]|nr:alpha/beta hydrolase [Ardenticatenaceae bacterium]